VAGYRHQTGRANWTVLSADHISISPSIGNPSQYTLFLYQLSMRSFEDNTIPAPPNCVRLILSARRGWCFVNRHREWCCRRKRRRPKCCWALMDISRIPSRASPSEINDRVKIRQSSRRSTSAKVDDWSKSGEVGVGVFEDIIFWAATAALP